jgi:hypothetical protein
MASTRGIWGQGLRAGVLALMVLALLVSTGVAQTRAVFTASKSSTAAFTSATLGKPTVSLAKGTGNTVVVTWTAVTASGTVKYYVTRDGGTPLGNCPTSAAPSTVRTCTDTWLSSGSHTYTVTAVYENWTATSSTVSISVTAPTLTFTSKLAADGYIAVTVTGAGWTANTKVTLNYAFNTQTQMPLAPFNLNPTSSGAGAFTVKWEDNCIDGDGNQRHTDDPAWVWGTDGTYSVIGTGTIVCSKYTH